MKKLLMLVISLLFFLTSCNYTNEIEVPNKILKISDFSKIKEIHFDFLNNVKNNQLDKLKHKKYRDNFYKEFSSTVNSSQNEKHLELFEKLNQMDYTKSSDTLSFKEMIEGYYQDKKIDDFEYISLKNLAAKMAENAEGYISNSELENYVYSLEDKWNQQRYTENSEHGWVLGAVLVTTISTIEWWHLNSHDIALTQKTIDPFLIFLGINQFFGKVNLPVVVVLLTCIRVVL